MVTLSQIAKLNIKPHCAQRAANSKVGHIIMWAILKAQHDTMVKQLRGVK